jgi:hypothetical protein
MPLNSLSEPDSDTSSGDIGPSRLSSALVGVNSDWSTADIFTHPVPTADYAAMD